MTGELFEQPVITPAITRSPTVASLFAALAAAQGQMENAAKDTTNTFYKSKYADLGSVWDAIRKPLSSNGLSVIQMPTAVGSLVTITTILAHASGEWIESQLTVLAKEDSPQAVGSAITYARRYALQSVAGVAPEDDDGEQAQGRPQQQPQRQWAAPPPQKPPAKQRPVPKELDQIFLRVQKDPEHFKEAADLLYRKLEDEQGVDGVKKYDVIQRAFVAKFGGRNKPGISDMHGFLLDLWDAAQVPPEVENAAK